MKIWLLYIVRDLIMTSHGSGVGGNVIQSKSKIADTQNSELLTFFGENCKNRQKCMEVSLTDGLIG